ALPRSPETLARAEMNLDLRDARHSHRLADPLALPGGLNRRCRVFDTKTTQSRRRQKQHCSSGKQNTFGAFHSGSETGDSSRIRDIKRSGGGRELPKMTARRRAS